MKQTIFLTVIFLMAFASGGRQQRDTKAGHENNPYYSNTDTTRLNVSNAQWKKILPAELYAVAREAATQPAFTGKYWNKNPKGTYIVPYAAINFSGQMLSLQVPVDGPVSFKRFVPTV